MHVIVSEHVIAVNISITSCGRDYRTRTCGILVPNQALYQTELNPDLVFLLTTILLYHVFLFLSSIFLIFFYFFAPLNMLWNWELYHSILGAKDRIEPPTSWLWAKRATTALLRNIFGAGGRIRTPDLLITKQLLCLLSYTSMYDGVCPSNFYSSSMDCNLWLTNKSYLMLKISTKSHLDIFARRKLPCHEGAHRYAANSILNFAVNKEFNNIVVYNFNGIILVSIFPAFCHANVRLSYLISNIKSIVKEKSAKDVYISYTKWLYKQESNLLKSN